MTAALIYNHANVDVINKCHYSVTYVPKLVKKKLIDGRRHIPPYKISCKYLTSRLNYNNFLKFKMVAVRHLGFSIS